MFESSAGELVDSLFHEFCKPYLLQIGARVRERVGAAVPLIVFARGAMHSLRELSRTSAYDVYGVDWTVPAKTARCGRQRGWRRAARLTRRAAQG